MNSVSLIMFILLIIGGLNWGLVGLLNFNLVALLFGDMSLISRLVYSLVGISAVYVAFNLVSLAED
jgi:uncharacterized membrane protein YuzA (DUF378 family)